MQHTNALTAKNAGGKVSIIGADRVIDVEVHYKEEIWWVVAFALLYL